MNISRVTLRKKYKEQSSSKINELKEQEELQKKKEMQVKDELQAKKEMNRIEALRIKRELQDLEYQNQLQEKKELIIIEEYKMARLQDIKMQITVYGTLLVTLFGIFVMIAAKDLVEYYLLVSAGITALVSVFFDSLLNSPKKISDSVGVYSNKFLSGGMLLAFLSVLYIFFSSLCERDWITALGAIFFIVLLFFLRIGIPQIDKYINKVPEK